MKGKISQNKTWLIFLETFSSARFLTPGRDTARDTRRYKEQYGNKYQKWDSEQ
jgi:hypothetical protein